jgi:NAD-dependent deacetylase
MRPDVVWFGELLPMEAVERAWRAAATAQLFLVVGTSALVYPAARIPYLAKEADAFVVEVNTTPTPFSDEADLVLRGTAGHWLPLLVGALAAGRERADP